MEKKKREIKFRVFKRHYQWAADLIKQHPKLGFESVEDLARVALREKVLELAGWGPRRRYL